MNALTKIEGTAITAMNEEQMLAVLKSSLYPGAKDESVKMVLGYCRAAGLDPMQKPVHIVPMSVSTGKKGADGWDVKEMRDVIMPGIGMYRTQAARSGEYAGVSEPEFGDDVTKALGDGPEITFPLWCRITVKRLVSGREVSFTAKEYWLENYATKSSKSAEPNAMWKKRPYAQLAKCAEAQALRKAFPEVGAQATADELEGQQIVEHDITPPARHVAMPRAKAAPVSDAQLVDADPASAPEAPINTAGLASKGEKAFLVRRAGDKNIDLKEVCAASGITDFENLTTDGFQVLKEALK